ncbi:MAG: hypothetical protein QGF94_00395 [Candidatus Thalassarchaeaceae archaeon]|nr:hypothetical protein [Candidatus Thalassarchaeaceae archaeon]
MSELRGLLKRLQSAGVPMTSAISAAMRSVNIGEYTDYELEPFWHDRPIVFLETSKGGVKTISAPHMIATMIHHLELSPGQEVLILGAKGGYIAALVAHMVGPEGGVVVVDPSREVVDHVRHRLQSVSQTHTVRVRKMRELSRCPPHLPEPLDRVLVTGSLSDLPEWLEKRMADGGFAIAPMGGKIAQRLVKRECQSGDWYDTDLGGVLFGPIDISDTEPEPLCASALAEMLREAVILGDELQIFDDEIRTNLVELATSLEGLPADLPPLPVREESFEDEPPWALDADAWEGEVHPIVDLLTSEMAWLSEIWPLLIALIDVRMVHPGQPGEDDEEGRSGGFGRHGDLVP